MHASPLSQAQLLARALCKNDARPPPHTALLVGGLSRGFTLPERWLSLQRNVIDALGNPNTELLLYLKVFHGDAPPSAKWRPRAGSNMSADFEVDSTSALELVVRTLAPAAVVIDRYAQREPSLRWQRNRTCVARGAADGIGLGPERRELLWPAVQLGYWHTLKQLWQMLCQRETARAATFEQVMFLRPDLVHFLSVGPYCLYRPKTVYHSMGDDCHELQHVSTPRFAKICRQKGGADFWWMAPRIYAEHAAQTLDRLMNCTTFFSMNEDFFYHDSRPFAADAGLTFVRTSGLLGASLVQRPAAPVTAVQGVGGALGLLAQHVELMALLYNESRHRNHR
ncbi:hypothetical protein AB1Y20_008924 [Prymnesium parvum]|uniref:Protein xylosyltransferase n=1 Tax=Prymnesium parvum TaxID=97485 RepID=A0AB34K043_PRYPA